MKIYIIVKDDEMGEKSVQHIFANSTDAAIMWRAFGSDRYCYTILEREITE